MAVLHEGAGELAEADRNRDIGAAAGVCQTRYTVHVLARTDFPRWRNGTIAVQVLALLEVDMHRMAPATAAISDVPDLHTTTDGLRGGRDTVHVRIP